MKLLLVPHLLSISINIEGGYEPRGDDSHYIDGAIFIYMDGNVNLIKKGDKTKPLQIFNCGYQFDGIHLTLSGERCDEMVQKSGGELGSKSLTIIVAGGELIFHQTSGIVWYKKTTS